MIAYMRSVKRISVGPVGQKVLLALVTGVRLSLTTRPDTYFRILRYARKEWKKINEATLRRAIRRLYESKLVDYKAHADGSVELVLCDEGKRKSLTYQLKDMKIEKPERWDGLWRLILFDIPEKRRLGRDALAKKLKELGFYSFQKSAFIFPYECKDELDYIIELFDLRPYVRLLTVNDVDTGADLKQKFGLK